MALHVPFDIKVADGLVSGVLHLPPSTQPKAAVLICCDLPGSLHDRSSLTDAVVESLNEAGIATAEFAPRQSETSSRANAVDVVNDAVAVFRWLEQRKDLDSRRLGLLGCGLGAVVAAALAARMEQVNRVCLLAPLTGAEALNRLHRPDHAEPLLDPESIDDAYRESIDALSPLEDILMFDRATLILNGAADRVAPPDCIRPYVKAIETAGHQIERESIALADHACSDPDARAICAARVERFFSLMSESPVEAPASPRAASSPLPAPATS